MWIEAGGDPDHPEGLHLLKFPGTASRAETAESQLLNSKVKHSALRLPWRRYRLRCG